jgi:hypothetical protein
LLRDTDEKGVCKMTDQRQMNEQRPPNDQQRHQGTQQDHKDDPSRAGRDDQGKTGGQRQEPSRQFPGAGQDEKLEADRADQRDQRNKK